VTRSAGKPSPTARFRRRDVRFTHDLGIALDACKLGWGDRQRGTACFLFSTQARIALTMHDPMRRPRGFLRSTSCSCICRCTWHRPIAARTRAWPATFQGAHARCLDDVLDLHVLAALCFEHPARLLE
jgi:hypothetical protein